MKSIFSDQSSKYQFLFYSFILLHVILWTLLPTLTRSNLHLDTLEALSWGQEWQWGYQKHPPLSAWFAEFFIVYLGKKIWVCYFLSQVCIALSMIATWRLAKIFLPLEKALMAVLLLEGIYYYNFTSTEFNTNLLTMALWSWIIFYAWQACDKNLAKSWLMIGALAALGILTKYYVLILIAAISLMIIYEKQFRRHLKSYKPYLALLPFLLILTPHFFWLVKNNFPTISYINDRAAADYHFYNNLLFPILFILAQAFSMLFALVIFFFAFRKNLTNKWHKISFDPKKIFLIFMIFAPLILTIAPSLLTGSKMKDMWGTSLWGLCGIFLFYFFVPKISATTSKRFYIAWLFTIIISISAYLISNEVTTARLDKRDSFNGQEAAREVMKRWCAKQRTALKIIVSDIWIGSNISFFSPSNPKVFIDMNEKISPWLSYQALQINGGVIVWDINEEGEELPKRYRNKINSKIIIEEPLFISSTARKYKNQPPFKLGVAIIVPNFCA